MHKIFTPEDLVRFVYNEMSSVEAEELQEELQSCGELHDEFEQIAGMKMLMSTPKVGAAPEIINSILNYSKSLRITQLSSTVKTIEVNLN
jgi:hypothetical protein